MNSVHLTTSFLYLLGSVAALVIVATWPRVRGKGWLIGALSILVVTRIFFPLMYVSEAVFGRSEAHSILRAFGWVTQIANVIGAALLVVAVVQLRECLNGRASSKTTFRSNLFQAAPLLPGITVCVGMSLPWAHRGESWVSGWSTSANILGVELPGVFIAIAATISIAAMLTRVGDSNRKHHWGSLMVCGYGLLHSIFMGFALLNTPGMNMGCGVVVTIVGLIMLSFCSVSLHSENRIAHEANAPVAA